MENLFLITGILGGFTTFSAFGYEAIYLFRRGDIFGMISMVGVTVIGGFLLVWLGIKVGYTNLF